MNLARIQLDKLLDTDDVIIDGVLQLDKIDYVIGKVVDSPSSFHCWQKDGCRITFEVRGLHSLYVKVETEPDDEYKAVRSIAKTAKDERLQERRDHRAKMEKQYPASYTRLFD